MQTLDEYTVAPYLVTCGILQPACLLDPALRIYRVSRRHQGFAVLDGDGSGVYVKQATAGAGFGSVSHEAAVYELLHSPGAFDRLAGQVPQVADWRMPADSGNEGVLVLRWLPGSSDLFCALADMGSRQPAIAAALGALFAGLHGQDPATAPYRLPAHPVPRVVDLCLPAPSLVWSASPAGLEMVRMLQRHEAFADGLGRVRAAWKPVAPVHFDVKLANLLVSSRADGGETEQLTLIDWEYAGLGDPRWDIGSLFAALLDLWLVTTLPPERVGRSPASAATPLDFTCVQQMLAGTWRAYCAAGGPIATTAIDTVLQFTAARLVHTAFELALDKASLDARIAALLQLALNIFRLPDKAPAELMGEVR